MEQAAVIAPASTGARRWLVGVAAGVGSALLIGVPTGVVETSLYTRMTPVEWWNYPVWAVSAVLIGLTAATFAGGGAPRAGGGRRLAGGTVLSAFAIGCPVCNKLVVALLGVSGALGYWAPLQPLLGLASIGLLATALVVRVRAQRACRLEPAAVVSPGSARPR